MKNEILLNHVGFPCLAPKRFLIQNPPERAFRVENLIHCVRKTVYEGTLTPLQNGWWQGDFTAVQAPCDYCICVGSLQSRYFVIYDGAYQMAERLLLQYFTVQRCGSPLGWAGMCHQEDGYIAETGERMDLTGGYHQSADLRKSPGGVPIGVIGLMRWAALRRPAWGKESVPAELRWACDYYLKTVQPNGCVYNTLNAPLGWDGRLFYASGAQANAQWNTLILLALGAKAFESDVDYAKRLSATALRIWQYMNRPDRSTEIYRHPDILPRGMDADFFFRASFKDSTADLSGKLMAAVALYRLFGTEWTETVVETADRICERQVTGNPDENPAVGAFFIAENDLRLMDCMGGYGSLPGRDNALCDACDLLPHHPHAAKWLEAIRLQADLQVRLSAQTPWGDCGNRAREAKLNEPAAHPTPGKAPRHVRDSFMNAVPWGTVKNADGEQANCVTQPAHSPLMLSEKAVFLRRAARLLHHEPYRILAQQHLDNILGANPCDMSSVEGVGFNQTCPPVFGQFFPSTPQIPGGVYHTGYGEKADGTCRNGGEYDMPAVGMLLWAIAENGLRPEYAQHLMRKQYEDTWGKRP